MRYKIVLYDDKSNEELRNDNALWEVMKILKDALEPHGFDVAAIHMNDDLIHPALTRKDAWRENEGISQDSDAVQA